MNIDLVRAAVQAAPIGVRSLLRDFVRTRTERNSCYATGYLTALKHHGLLPTDNYHILLSLVGEIEQGHVNKETIQGLTS